MTQVNYTPIKPGRFNLALNGLILVMSFWWHFNAIHFLKNHHRIDNPKTFAAFKNLARQNMYMAIAYLLLAVPAMGIGIYLVIKGGLLYRITVFVVIAVSTLVSTHLKKTEQRTRELPCSNSRVEDAYMRIIHSWKKKLIPDF